MENFRVGLQSRGGGPIFFGFLDKLFFYSGSPVRRIVSGIRISIAEGWGDDFGDGKVRRNGGF